jgi:DNA-binding NarL/FixJ family response regulator
MTSVLIADDHDMVRYGFRMVLAAQPGLTVVGEAANGDTAWELVRRLRPAVLLADIRMPGIDGLELTRRVATAPELDTKAIVVTTFNDDEYVARALRDGASGFLLKASAPGLLVEAIRAALAGNALVSPEVTVPPAAAAANRRHGTPPGATADRARAGHRQARGAGTEQR